MAKARFEWDPRKDQENRRKHGVAFAMAQLGLRLSSAKTALDLDEGHEIVAELVGHAR